MNLGLPANDAATLCDRLAAALARDAPAWHGTALEPLRDAGLAHAHVRLVGRGALARIPKQSQLGLPAEANLAYQAACFTRASPGGHAPRLLALLAPSPELPRGALIVEEIVGRPAAFPGDLGAVMTALARLHAMPLLADAERAPLLNEPDPLRALLAEIEAQARHLDAGVPDREVRATIAAEIERLRTLCARAARPPRCLIAFDAHPGNFIVRDNGDAVLVDLEKCRYAAASLDIAHATLVTSTTWDVSGGVSLTTDEIVTAYAAWSTVFGDAAVAHARWHLPLRRAMWLWSVTWCAKWRAGSGASATNAAHGEDWSTELSAPELVAHVGGRVDLYLSSACIDGVRDEFDVLAGAFGGGAA